MPVDPPLQAALDQLLAAGGPKLHEVGSEQARSFYDAMNAPRPDLVVEKIEDARLPGPAGDIPVRIYRPVAGDARP